MSLASNCTYTIKLGNITKSLTSERDLDEFLLNEAIYKEILELIPNSKELFSFDKNTTTVLDSAQREARAKLKVVKAKALAEYLNIEDTIETEDTKHISVMNWIARIGLANPINRDDYRRVGVSNIRANNPAITEEEANKLIDKEFASWSYSQQLGRGLHYVAGLIFNKHDTLTPEQARLELNSSWTKGFSKDASLKGVTDDALNGFITQITKLKRQLITPEVDRIYTEYVVENEVDENNNLIGKVDLIVVKKDGSVHIYDIKVSKSKYDDWDRERKNFTKFQLATYKRLLQLKGINPRKIATSIIPIEINIDKEQIYEDNGELIVKDNADVVTAVTVNPPMALSIADDAKLSKAFNEKFPVNSTIQLGTSKLEESATDNLVKYFPVECLNGNKFKNVEKQTLINKLKKDSSGKYRFYDNIANKLEIFDSEEKAIEFIDKYLESIDERVAEQVAAITTAFKETLERVNSTNYYQALNYMFPNIKNQEHQEYINTLLFKYTYEKGWKVVENDDLINMGVIMLVNDINKKVDFISLISTDPTATIHLDKGTTLLGSFYTDTEVETNNNVLKATKSNIELIKLLEVADNILTDNLKEYEVDELIVTNITSKQSVKPTSLDKILENYNMLRSKANRNQSNLVLIDPLFKFFQLFNEMQEGLSNSSRYSRLSNTIKGKLKQINTRITELTPDEKNNQITQLYSLLIDLKNRFFFDGYKPNGTLESALYAEIAKAIINLSGIEVDPYNAPKLAEWFGDVLKDGGISRQLFNSTKLNTADTITLIKPIKQALDSTRYNIKSRYYNYKSEVRKKYKEFKSGVYSNRFTNLSEMEYKNLFDLSENGRKYFLLKDPKTDTTLNDDQRKFLEFYLNDINALRFPGQTEEELRKTGQWLMAGIMKASAASRIANGKNIFTASAANVTDEIFNRKQIVEEDKIKSYTELNDNDMMEMYNIFASSNTMEARAKLVENMTKEKGDIMTVFETNLEIVADSMHLAYIRESEYNRVLPIIQANLTILRLSSFITNDKQIDKTIKFVSDHIKTTVFDESLIDSESKQMYTVLSHLKRWASGCILGFNYKSGIKETAVSFFNLYIRAIANSVADKDRIGLKDMTKAYGIVWKDAMSQIGTLTKLESLNFVYGIANMSEDELVARQNYYQGDAFRFQSNLFWCNRAPDYLNRCTLLVGYMLKYGCYDAYTMKDDKLVYDWKKDKRFELLAQYNDSTVPTNKKKEYNYQKALYNTMLERFVNQGFKINDNGRERVITMKDNLPHAFTDLEVASIKQEADSLFGYMDNDNKSEVFKTGLFTLIGHFRTYLTAKKNQWFLTRDTYAEGQFIQARNDKGQLLYKKHNGNIIEVTTEVTNDPYIVWQGRVTEGIFWSLLDLTTNLGLSLTGNKEKWEAFKSAWADPVKKRNTIIAAQELFLVWLINKILELAFEDVKPSEVTNAQRMFIGLTKEISNEMLAWKVLSGATEFNAPSISYAQQVWGDLSDAFDGKLNIGRVVTNNLGVLRPFRRTINEYLPNPEYEKSATD